jgi:hypothetical protein
MKKYYIGYIFDHGGVIVDGPLKERDGKGKQYSKWKVRCPNCNTETWKFSNTLTGLKYPCKRCYDNSMKLYENEGPAIRKAFMSLKSNAKSRGLSVELSEDNFFEIAKNKCIYCDASPTEKTPPKKWQISVYLNGIDRVDNSIGYTVENSVACCKQCNWSKKDLTLEEWNLWIDMIIKKRDLL